MNGIVRISLALTAVAVVALTPPATANGQDEKNQVAVVFGMTEPIEGTIPFSPPVNPFGDSVEFSGGWPDIEADVLTINSGPGTNHDLIPPGVIENPRQWSSGGIKDPSATEGKALVAKFFIDSDATDSERYVEAFVGWGEPGLATFDGDPELTNDPVAGMNNVIAIRNDQGSISTNHDIWDGSTWNTFGSTASVTWVWSDDRSIITMYVPNRQFESIGDTFDLTVFIADQSGEPSADNFAVQSAEVTTDQVPVRTVEEISASSGFDEVVATALTTGQPLSATTPADSETTNEPGATAAAPTEALEGAVPDAGGSATDADADSTPSDGQTNGEAAGEASSGGGFPVAPVAVPLVVGGVVVGSLIKTKHRRSKTGVGDAPTRSPDSTPTITEPMRPADGWRRIWSQDDTLLPIAVSAVQVGAPVVDGFVVPPEKVWRKMIQELDLDVVSRDILTTYVDLAFGQAKNPPIVNSSREAVYNVWFDSPSDHPMKVYDTDNVHVTVPRGAQIGIDTTTGALRWVPREALDAPWDDGERAWEGDSMLGGLDEQVNERGMPS